MSEPRHIPVLAREVLEALQPHDGGRYLDGTFGAGGYTALMLDRADCRVFAIDRDPDAVAAGQALADRYAPRLRLVEGRFGDMAELLSAEGVEDVDGVALDLGVSSMQFDQAEPRLLLPRRRSARHAHGEERHVGRRSRKRSG